MTTPHADAEIAISPSTQTTAKPTTVKLLMWTISSPLADKLFAWSNLLLVVGAAAVLIGTIGAIMMSGVREQFSNERVAANERATAEAVERSLKLQLQIDILRTPRAILPNQLPALVKLLAAFRGQTYWALLPPAGEDTESLWADLVRMLSAAGWQRVDPPGLKTSGDIAHGVSVNAYPGLSIIVAPSRAVTLYPQASALAGALNSIGIKAVVEKAVAAQKLPDAILIAIGLKPEQ